jgi:hypothetical protein
MNFKRMIFSDRVSRSSQLFLQEIIHQWTETFSIYTTWKDGVVWDITDKTQILAMNVYNAIFQYPLLFISTSFIWVSTLVIHDFFLSFNRHLYFSIFFCCILWLVYRLYFSLIKQWREKFDGFCLTFHFQYMKKKKSKLWFWRTITHDRRTILLWKRQDDWFLFKKSYFCLL